MMDGVQRLLMFTDRKWYPSSVFGHSETKIFNIEVIVALNCTGLLLAYNKIKREVLYICMLLYEEGSAKRRCKNRYFTKHLRLNLSPTSPAKFISY